jgi:translation initiation factor eIF-2B subunit delta
MMSENTTNSAAPSLNPAAPSFSMPASNESHATHPEQTMSNGTNSNKPTKSDRPAKQDAKPPATQAVAEAGTGTKLSGAELKKQKAAEKAARRADKVAQKAPDAPPAASSQSSTSGKQPRRPSVGGKKDSAEPSHHKRTGSTQVKTMPIRSQAAAPQTPAVPEKDDKRVAMFTHLRSKEERTTLASAGREIHPAVLSLGLQLRDYVICGANARCIAMLLVFKKVVSSYSTPPGVALSRHLTTHLSHQISYINHARPLGVSQGNAIRWLKKLISTLDPDLAELEAKKFLASAIDTYLREKITLADEVIASHAEQRIDNGDVILTYGKSSVVEKALLTAAQNGKRFTVIVVDSRPMFEGKNLARSLIRQGIETRYCLLSALADVVEDATKCMLGAAAMLSNGRLSARAGTAMVAMMVKDSTKAKAPVMVLCETYKFTSKVALDSIMMNELGEPEALVELEEVETIATAPPPPASGAKGGKKGKDEDVAEVPKRGLEGWRDQKNLFLLSLMYDVTPADCLSVVITEMGAMPPSAVSEANRLHGGEE